MTKLPVGWSNTTLGNLGEWSSGGTPSRKVAAYFGGTVPWVKTGDLKHKVLKEGDVEERITEAGLSSSAAKVFPRGSLLIAMYGATIGQTAMLDIDAATNQACAALLASEANAQIIRFVWLYVILEQENLKAIGQGGAQPNISQTILRNYPVRVAPIAEQNRIVAKIDSLSAKSRSAREHLDHIPRLVEKYKQAILAAAFTGELTAMWRQQTGQKFSSWTTALWSNAGQTINGRAFPSSDYCIAGVKLLRPGNLDANGEVTWTAQNTRFLPTDYANRFPGYLFRGQELLINLTAQSLEDAFLGRACLSAEDDQFLLNQRIAIFRPNNMDKRYCLYVLKSPLFRSFVDNGLNAGSLIQHVHTKQLAKFAFPIAPAHEQLEIVRRIDSAFAWIDRLASEATGARALIERLGQSVLAKAFRGELVPQDPNDEPASVLLERIKAERAATGNSNKAKAPRRRKA